LIDWIGLGLKNGPMCNSGVNARFTCAARFTLSGVCKNTTEQQRKNYISSLLTALFNTDNTLQIDGNKVDLLKRAFQLHYTHSLANNFKQQTSL